ncbi:MAG: TIGR00269 family protein [Methanosarcinales archaeon]|nr:TIGR00269 family protein [Methanosarcinales archaeon]
MKCTKCNRTAVTYQPYSGAHLCDIHLIKDVERKVKHTIRQHRMMERGDTIAVALSGGKDSSVLLYLLSNLFGHRPDITLIAISIDEGIAGYRSHTLQHARDMSAKLGITHIITGFKEEYGMTLDEIVAKGGEKGPCSYCGALRKRLLNKTARDAGASRLAIGHNLDDEAQTVMMNIMRADVERMVRMVPACVQPGLVLRSKPLRDIPEREVALYALLHDINVNFNECPYAYSAIRGDVRDLLNDFEVKHPGTKYAVLRSLDKLCEPLRYVFPQSTLGSCIICGEPTQSDLCQTCRLLDRS